MDNEEKNVVDLLIKRLEMAPAEFFKVRAGSSSEQMYDSALRELPPYMMPQWARVVRQVMYGASDKDWTRLREAFGKALMHLAEAEFYDTVDRMKDDSVEHAQIDTRQQLHEMAKLQMAQAQMRQRGNAFPPSNSLAGGVSQGQSSGADAVRADKLQLFDFDRMLKKMGFI